MADLSPNSLKRKLICSKHFNEIFTQSTKLPLNAEPFRYISDESSGSESDTENSDNPIAHMNVVPVTKTYPGPSKKNSSGRNYHMEIDLISSDGSLHEQEDENWLRDLYNLPTKSIGSEKKNRLLEEENKRLRLELENSRKKLNNTKVQLRNAKKKIMNAEHHTKTFGEASITGFAKSLINMQVRHRAKSPWQASEKRDALSLFYRGPKTYRYLRQKGINLPGISTLKSWINNFNCKPGFNKKIFLQLSLKADSMMPREKKCILMFDEMSIKRNIDYNKHTDMIEGFEDLGEFGRKSSPARQALVLMIRGIYSTWKIPIAFFVSDDGVSCESLLLIIKKALEKLRGSKLDTIGIVCDLSSTNKKMFKQLGVEKTKPYFHLNERKYFAFFDVPHLIKSVRNNFINTNLILNEKYICFSDIKQVYDIDKKSSTGKALLKLTDKHLNPNSFQKMNVKLATQLLSHSVYAALMTSSRTGELVSPTAENTAHFVKTMDNLFDALNSTRLHSTKPCNRVLSDTNPEVLAAINEGYEVLENLYKVGKKDKLTRPDCYDGFLLTINAVKQFATNEKNEGYKFLFTGRLIQDPLENQFSVYRQRGGYNRNPTVRTFRSSFKISIVTNFMRPPRSANAGGQPDDDDNFLLTDGNEALALLNVVEESSSSSDTDSSSSSSDGSVVQLNDSATLEKCSVIYFAGYLVKKCLDRFECEDCKTSLEADKDFDNEGEILIFFKNYDLKYETGLRTPTSLLREFTRRALDCFSRDIGKHLNHKLMSNLKRKLVKNIKTHLPEWFATNMICEKHRQYILELLLRTQIFKYCKYISSQMKTRQSTNNVKLTILQHN